MVLVVNSDRMRECFERLRAFGEAPGGGVNRIAFGMAFLSAREWLRDEMNSAGLDTRLDAAGNLLGKLGGGNDVVMVGSHLDTVPSGGRFDGALGVVAGLECIRVVQEQQGQPRRSIEVVAFNEEEGAYYSLLGSRALTGALDIESMAKADEAQTAHLAKAMNSCGLSIDLLPTAKRRMEDIRAYLELHVEQGPRLDRAGFPIGVVDSIVGLAHYRVAFTGEADHAGTTPMDARKDALLGAAEFVLAATEWVSRSHRKSTFNAGCIEVLPGASNIVPREATLSVEFRSASPKEMEELRKGILDIGEAVARDRGLAFSGIHVSTDPPVSLSADLRGLIEQTATDLGYEYMVLDSGAGHDAQAIALHADAGMIFVPSVGGKSHCPEEATRWEDIEKGANLLLNCLMRIAEG
jgi:N-carbamoyl-L-amino-acid hydrolase